MAMIKFRDKDGNVKELLTLRGEKGEDSTKLLRVTVTDGYASHTPAEIKAFCDNGGLVVLNDKAFLQFADETWVNFVYYSITLLTIEITEYSWGTDKRVFTDPYTYEPMSPTDKTLSAQNVPADANVVGQKFDEVRVNIEDLRSIANRHEESLGDIETALDHILAVQQALIGGDTE